MNTSTLVLYAVSLTIGELWSASQPRLTAARPTNALQWQEVELTFTATRDAANPYMDADAWVQFTHDDGTKIRRPMFWDGGRKFRVRFASTKSSGRGCLTRRMPQVQILHRPFLRGPQCAASSTLAVDWVSIR